MKTILILLLISISCSQAFHKNGGVTPPPSRHQTTFQFPGPVSNKYWEPNKQQIKTVMKFPNNKSPPQSTFKFPSNERRNSPKSYESTFFKPSSPAQGVGALEAKILPGMLGSTKYLELNLLDRFGSSSSRDARKETEAELPFVTSSKNNNVGVLQNGWVHTTSFLSNKSSPRQQNSSRDFVASQPQRGGSGLFSPENTIYEDNGWIGLLTPSVEPIHFARAVTSLPENLTMMSTPTTLIAMKNNKTSKINASKFKYETTKLSKSKRKSIPMKSPVFNKSLKSKYPNLRNGTIKNKPKSTSSSVTNSTETVTEKSQKVTQTTQTISSSPSTSTTPFPTIVNQNPQNSSKDSNGDFYHLSGGLFRNSRKPEVLDKNTKYSGETYSTKKISAPSTFTIPILDSSNFHPYSQPSSYQSSINHQSSTINPMTYDPFLMSKISNPYLGSVSDAYQKNSFLEPHDIQVSTDIQVQTKPHISSPSPSKQIIQFTPLDVRPSYDDQSHNSLQQIQTKLSHDHTQPPKYQAFFPNQNSAPITMHPRRNFIRSEFMPPPPYSNFLFPRPRPHPRQRQPRYRNSPYYRLNGPPRPRRMTNIPEVGIARTISGSKKNKKKSIKKGSATTTPASIWTLPLKKRFGLVKDDEDFSKEYEDDSAEQFFGFGLDAGGMPIVDPQHPVVQNALNPLGNPAREPDQLIKKKSKFLDPTSLIPLDKSVVVCSIMIGWLLTFLFLFSYKAWGGNGRSTGGVDDDNNSLGHSKPLLLNIPDMDNHGEARAISNTGNWNFNWAKVLDYIDIAQKTYEGFDWQNLDCQKRVLCEIAQERSPAGETGRKITNSYLLSVAEAVEGMPMPKIIQAYLSQYKEAIIQGKSKKVCGEVYSKCKFSISKLVSDMKIKNKE